MVGMFQPWHLIVVLVIVMMVFGPGKLPELGKAVGDGFRELKRSTNQEPITTSNQEPITTTPLCPSCGGSLAAAQPFCGGCGLKQAA